MYAKKSSFRPEKKASQYEIEKQLWAGIRNNNQEDLSTLFSMYYSQLFRYGYKIVPREEVVKDCIQELFLSIWKSRSKVSGAISVKSYMFSSMRRTIFRELRKQKAQKNRDREYVDCHCIKKNNAEESLVECETKAENKKLLLTAIKLLGKKQREAIYLKFYEGMNCEEIAMIMGIQRQSVYNHVSEGIQKLQAHAVE